MSESEALERRWRRVLKFYPKTFREDHEQEMLSVLMADGGDDGSHPTVADVVNVATHGVFMRGRHAKLYSSWAAEHARTVILIRVLTGLWLTVLTAIFCAGEHWWALVLLIPAVLHFALAANLGRAVRGAAPLSADSPGTSR